MRFLVYLVTILLFSTAVAQNPTILQGNYITNVFGQANFIKNPNGLLLGSSTTNNPNVTTSSATVTRSTSSPLVATSEFTVTTSTSSGFAEWQTRAFDQGMKNQICEARFIYRGFATGTTTAQVYRGSAAIAQQVLTPSTDPQTVSITFPCGDLAATPTFRLQQSGANLTGTNEIGGIYMGLATNLSTVAQATKVGGWDNVSCSSEPTLTTGTAWATPNVAGTCSGTAVGSASSALSNLNTLTFTFTNLAPGEYLLLMPAYVYTSSVQYARCDGRIRETTLNYVDGQNAFATYQTTGSTFASIGQINQFKFTNTATANRTFQIEFARTSGTSNCLGGFIGQSGGIASYQNISLYRFPTIGETVLTPNVTSTFAAASWTAEASFLRSSTAEATISDAVFSTNRTAFGKAQFTGTANDVAITVPNMPAGTYRIELTAAQLSGYNNTTTNDTGCNFYLKDGGSLVANARSNQYGPLYSKDGVSTATEIVTYTSVATRTFTASFAAITSVAQYCNVVKPKIIITPIDYQLPLPIFIDQTPYTVTATSLNVPTAPYARVEASGAGTTITLFGCTASTKGYSVEVKRVDASNNITVSRSGTDTIDGATTDLLAVNYQATQYVCNGSGGWRRF